MKWLTSVIKNKTIKNIVSLSLVQGLNYILPLITLPYLVRTLGVHSYGVLTFCVAFNQYFLLFTQFGFNFSATQRIAKARQEKEQISKIFFSVLGAKLFFCFVSFVVLCILIILVPYFYNIKVILLFSFVAIVGDVLFPGWFFQGEEKMSNIAISNILARLSTVPLIFLFVNSTDDVARAALFMGSANVLAGIIAMIAVVKSGRVSLYKPSIKDIKEEIICSWHFFISSAAMSLYTVTTPVLLGAISGPYVLGVFSAADKLRQALQGLLNPVSQALYPKISRMIKEQDRTTVFQFIRKLLTVQAVFGLVVSLICCLGASVIIPLVYNKSGTPDVIAVFEILAWIPFVVSISNVLGIQTLLTTGYKREFSQVIITGGVVNIVLLCLLAFHFEAFGAALSILITEAIITIGMSRMIMKLKIPLFNR
ncbi:flippase [Enterobacteriaceae bacterium BIT-l23]|uniref:flippase n=1 Tax=Jejubacter sp. L23 TaxID=3092086 RepID=UPI001584B83F|nr:flippase [Enterobacteriaceae bacterium BIT-l23]